MTYSWNMHYLSSVMPISDILANDNISWNKEGLSMNPDITIDLVLGDNNWTGYWNWGELSTVIPIEEIKNNPNLPWCKISIPKNKEFSLVYRDLADESSIWIFLSIKTSMSQVIDNSHLPWRKEYLSKNKNINSIVLKMDLPNATGEWNWTIISKIIDMKEVRSNSLPWCKNGLSYNEGITMADIEDIDSNNWRLRHLSKNIPIEEIRHNNHIRWQWYGITQNSGVTIDDALFMGIEKPTGRRSMYYLSKYASPSDIKNNPSISWSREGLSENRRIDTDILNMPNTTGDWCWRMLSRYAPIIMVKNNPHLPWRKDYLSMNRNIDICMLHNQ